MKNREVLLVTYGGKEPFLPLGALAVAGALRKRGFSPHLIDTGVPKETFRRRLDEIRPLFVGFSAYTFPKLSELVERSVIAKEEGYPVAWGGHHATVLSEQCVAEEFIDYALVGEGEEITAGFAQALLEGRPQQRIFRQEGVLRNIDDYLPAFDLVDLADYVTEAEPSIIAHTGSIKTFRYLITSRGCLSSCKFCGVHNIYSEGRKAVWTGHSVGYVKDELDLIRRDVPDLESVVLWDDNFFGGKRLDDHSYGVLTMLKEEGIRYNLEVRADFLKDREHVRFLKGTGALQAFNGAESGSQHVLDLMRKGASVEDYLTAAGNCVAEGLPIRLSFFYGYPGETLEDIESTKAFIAELRGYGDLVSISGPKMYRPVPGTEGYREALTLGFQAPMDTLGWSRINSSEDPTLLPWLVREAARAGVKEEDIPDWLGIRKD